MPLESIDFSARLIFGACALGVVAIIFGLIRGNVIKEKYALLWLPLGAGFLATSLFPELLLALSARIHLHYITVVVLGIIVVFTSILLYLTARLSRMREDIKCLAQELALARADRPQEARAEAGLSAAEGWSPAGPSRAGSRT
jgi:hypothetical protein